jgi:hypothetical protein
LRRGFAVLLLVVASAAAQTFGVLCQTLIVSDGVRTVYPVGQGFLVPGTDTVYVAGVRLDSTGYTFDYSTGSIIFWRRPEKWAPIRAVYRCVLLPGMPKVYRLRELPGTSVRLPAAETAAAVVAETTAAGTESTALALSGSKTLGVSFGGASAGIDQATRVTITGSVEGITVEAELSDQSSPIPAEGTTRDIEELDKLLISLRGKDWKGSFGDVDLQVPTGSFGTLERQAVGASAIWDAELPGSGQVTETLNPRIPGPPFTSSLGVYGGYATPKGQFGRVELAGIDGSQGPYILAPDGRSAEIVPGSEEVYLNGSRMVRGWDADYTIDYATGELLFTNRRLIDRLSRIEAKFQYRTTDYSRAIVIGGAKGRGPGVLGFTGSGAVGVFREGDDPANNYNDDLTQAEKDSLAAIGSDTARAWLGGATYAGEGKGDYVKSGNHYVYVGRDSGDFQVRFTLVGDSLGDYRYNDTILAYSYTGAGSGNYVAKRKIALPGRNEAGYARLGLTGHGFSAGVEGMLERRRMNLFAPGGAPIDAGALNVDAGWQDSSYGVAYKHRLQGKQFEAPAGSPDVDFTYRWAGTTENERRASDEVAARARPVSFLSLSGEAGRLDRFDSGPINRYSGAAQVGWLGYDITRVADITRQNVLAAPHLSWLYPRVGWQSEAKPEEKSSVWLAGLEVKPAASLSAGVNLRQTGYYEPDSAAGIWQGAGRARLIEALADWTRGAAYRLSARAGLDDRHFYSGSDQDWNQLLAGLSGSANPRAGLRLQADFNQSYRRVQLRDELFRYVGQGQGAYRRDSVTGRYYPDPDGDYERAVVATGRFTQAREWSLNSSGDISMFDPAALSGSFSQTRTSTDSGVLTDLSRQDLRLVVKQFEPTLTPTVGATSEFSADQTLVATGRATSHQQAYLELFSDRLPGVEGRARLEVERLLRRLSGGEVDLDQTGWRAELSPTIGRSPIRNSGGFRLTRVMPVSPARSPSAAGPGCGRRWR